VDHKDLDVWNKSIDLVLAVYKLTEAFPKTEVYGLVNQLRRSAVSIPSNIAEGAARSSDKEFIQFLYISLGSLSELETQIIISQKLGYMTNESELPNHILTIKKMTLGLIKYLKNKKPTPSVSA
jgi:four helix bundle protein